MRILKIEPGKPAYEKEIENTLESIQEEVGCGIFQVLYMDDGAILCYNDEGKLLGMDRLYTKGSPFPIYYYEPPTLVVEMTSARKPYRPDNEADKTWLFLPMSTKQLEHAMMRAGLVSFDDMRLRFVESNMPESVDAAINFEHEGILELNEMSKEIKALPDADKAKLDAVAMYVQPQYAFQMKLLAENLDLFDFIPGVQNAEE